MSSADSRSSLGLNIDPWSAGELPTGGAANRSPAGIWLDGDILACSCPECGSPMSIRLWLMLADCWRCGASIELSEEQEREALRLLEEREQRNSAASLAIDRQEIAPGPVLQSPESPKPPPAAEQAPTPPAAPAPKAKTESPKPPAAAPHPASPRPATAPANNPVFRDSPPRRAVAAQRPSRVRQQLQQAATAGLTRVWIHDLFRTLPAWLTSLIFHMLALILLGIWLVPQENDERSLILATQVGPEDTPGDLEDLAANEDPVTFEDPGDLDPQPEDQEELFADDGLTVTDELVNPFEQVGETPDQVELAINPVPLSAAAGAGSIFQGRDPTARAELVRTEGGTIASEAAVARGLEWLARHQNTDGSWSLSLFHRAGECRGRCGATGQPCDTAATGLALLPFLGAGETHIAGKYTEEVHRGLLWLIKKQQSDGNLWTTGMELSRMYAHGQATIALCEAYALTGDSTLAEPAQKAVDYIVKAQHAGGGWRYYPGSVGDMSVVGWQLMALRSAQIGGLKVPPVTFERATKFLDSVQTDSTGSQYAYQPHQAASPTMTAEALLCRQYGGWPSNHPGLQVGGRSLLDQNPPSRDQSNMYYWYYATQMMHHLGGPMWEQWNARMRDLLVETQETEGHQAGSWTPKGGYDPVGGRVYMTALAVCTLEVYYRHLPLYRGEAVDPRGDDPRGDEAKGNDKADDLQVE
jgi:hypothetical protein